MEFNQAMPKKYIHTAQFGAAKSWNRKVLAQSHTTSLPSLHQPLAQGYS